jgi:HEAT repeat protein
MPWFACSTILYLRGPAPAPQPWQFDATSALIGAAVALVLAWLAYRFRDALRLGWETVTAPLARLYHRLQASADDRYRELVATRARSLIVPAHLAPLDAVFIEPKLFSPPPLPQSISEVEPAPASQVLPLRRMLMGHSRLAILGTPGTGRTALLATIALTCARTANDEKDEGGRARARAMLEIPQKRLPLYVPLSAMDWSATDDEGGQESDAVQRLLSAAVTAVGGGSGLTRTVRQHLDTGQAIVLADSWDELSPQQRQWAAAWLSGLTDALPGNIWLIGAGTRGYAPLTEAGFVPLTLGPWDARQVKAFAERWVEACIPAGEQPPVTLHELVAELRPAARGGASPLELALRAFVCLSDKQPPVKRAALFDRALDLLLWQEKEPGTLATCRAVLGQVALTLQQEGRAAASREEIETAIETALPPLEERPARAPAHVFRALTGERGLLCPAGSNGYAFTHPLWQAYLAARQLVAVDPTTLVERLEDPRWTEVLRFYAELGNMGPLVATWLRGPDDIFHTRFHTLSSWISVAPEGASWRDGAMAVLARGLIQPGQPAQARHALAEALAATGVTGTIYFFRQALQHPHAQVRVAAALGLIRMASESDMAMLGALLEDEDPLVRQAAVRKLAHLNVDAATRKLAHILLEGDNTLRPVAASALAMRGEEGMAFLREVVESENVMARRAAVFGLAQAKARDLLEQVAREDEQWIVRSAASAALEEMDRQEQAAGVTPPPQIEQLPWLISWAATQGEGVGLGNAAQHMLRRALSEGDAPARLAAAQVLAQVGRPDDVELLQAVLADPDSTVADAALDALAEISRRYEVRVE